MALYPVIPAAAGIQVQSVCLRSSKMSMSWPARETLPIPGRSS